MEIAGFVSTGGNVPVPAVHRNNLALAELLDIEAPTPSETSRPLAQEPMYADDTHDPQSLGHAVLPDPARVEDPRSGAQLWVDIARAHPGESSWVSCWARTRTSPSRSRIEPELPRLLKRLHIMGGAINHRGNTGATSEWNFAVDPEAAERVLAAFTGAPARPVLGSLEATEAVQFHQDTLDRITQLGESTGHPVAMILAEALRFYFEFHQADGFGWMAHVHDPLVTAHAVTGQFAGERAAVPGRRRTRRYPHPRAERG